MSYALGKTAIQVVMTFCLNRSKFKRRVHSHTHGTRRFVIQQTASSCTCAMHRHLNSTVYGSFSSFFICSECRITHIVRWHTHFNLIRNSFYFNDNAYDDYDILVACFFFSFFWIRSGSSNIQSKNIRFVQNERRAKYKFWLGCYLGVA